MYRTIRKFIAQLFPANPQADISAESRDEFPQDSIMYSLDHPPYQLLQLGEVNPFFGWAFHYGGKTIKTLRVYADTAFVDEFPVDRQRDDVAGYFGHVPDVRRCGFDFRLYIDPAASSYDIQFVFGDGSTETFLSYDLCEIKALQHTLNKMKSVVDKIPVPDGDLVYVTLGHRDREVYKNSIIPCVINIMKYLRYCGVYEHRIRSILDFGCGSGRTLVGWFSDNPDRRLFGCDINGELIAWGRKNLPARIALQNTPILPPLPYPEDSFDFIHLISVFTHLSLQSQKRWIPEFKRILKPGGHLLITLHGGIYVNIFCPEKIGEFTGDGYVERVSPGEGSNDYAAFHAYGFAKDLFRDFAMSGYFPNGRIDDKRILFPLAGAQDVYLFQLQ